jgi:hypothetical protein
MAEAAEEAALLAQLQALNHSVQTFDNDHSAEKKTPQKLYPPAAPSPSLSTPFNSEM